MKGELVAYTPNESSFQEAMVKAMHSLRDDKYAGTKLSSPTLKRKKYGISMIKYGNIHFKIYNYIIIIIKILNITKIEIFKFYLIKI